MKILTVGDSWTWGADATCRKTMSWPAQLAKKYDVEVVNAASPGGSNKRASRIAIENISLDSSYDWVIFPLAPAARTEILKKGKWHQIWPNLGESQEDKLFADFWHPWNDVQEIILTSFYFINTMKALGVKCYVTGLSLRPSLYLEQLKWINEYKDDNDFASLQMPLQEFNISVGDLDRKLKCLRAMHKINHDNQPDYLLDVVDAWLMTPTTIEMYQNGWGETLHPDDRGYCALADYFADKIGLV